MLQAITAIDFHEMTRAVVDQLKESVTGDNFKLVIFDNISQEPYVRSEFGDAPFPIDIVMPHKNRGYYYPVKTLLEMYPKEKYISIMHNDLYIYEKGWNERLEACFEADQKLGLVGFVGSHEIDHQGGRGSGTMCYFRGDKGQDQTAGVRITDLRPSLVLDSLYMAFRAEAIPDLAIDEDITLGHFYDKIWPCTLIRNNWRVATLGVEVDHLGGVSTMAVQRWYDDCKAWFEERGKTWGEWGPETEMYLESSKRFVNEFLEFIPSFINHNYEIRGWPW